MQTQTPKKKKYNLKQIPMDLARIVCIPLLLVYRMKRLMPNGEPYQGHIHGGAILAANHTSFADPFLLGVAVWYRRMHFLAAEVVMKGKLRKWLLKGVGAIEIDRNTADIAAIRKSVEVLKKDRLLAIFPQGGIAHDKEIQSVKSGVVLIALQAGVPIIPMYICPKTHWYSRRVVVIGEPLDPKAYVQNAFPSMADIERVSRKLVEAMNLCVPHQ